MKHFKCTVWSAIHMVWIEIVGFKAGIMKIVRIKKKY